MINREDMLALTRRMTVKRTSITRIAGGYMDIDGFIDGTFNTSFLKLNPVEQEKNLYQMKMKIKKKLILLLFKKKKKIQKMLLKQVQKRAQKKQILSQLNQKQKIHKQKLRPA